jgi:indole-3-glycerol phosphate synthase
VILDDILIYRKKQLEEEMKIFSNKELEKAVSAMDLTRNDKFLNSIKSSSDIAIIAEVKKASPSKGIIKEDFEPLEIARQYEKANVAGISVLTEEHYFKGSNQYLLDINRNVSTPTLRKDFIFHEYQIYHAKFLGASAILLIAAILDNKQIKNLFSLAKELGLNVLFEVHDRSELERALEADFKLVGINNRNLKTFNTTLDVTENLIKYVPKDITIISESGIKDKNDVDRLKEMGAKGILAGEVFMRASSISEKISEFRGDLNENQSLWNNSN